MTKQKEPAWQKEPDRQKEIAGIFPDYMREKWRQALSQADKLQEIRLGIGQPVRLRIAGEERFLSSQGEICREPKEAWRMTGRELDELISHICRYSPYAFENEIRQGFITLPGGHRVGMAGQVVLNEKGAVRNMTHIRFLNIRISHEVVGAAGEVMPYLYEDARFLNTLLISPPGCGKTTMLRDIVRQVSGGNAYGPGRQVGVVDERSEIGGSFMGIPQNDLGMRTDVLDGCPKVQGMMLLMRSMAPDVVAVDEIGSSEDMKAVFQVLQCGGSVAATMHGDSMRDVECRLQAGGGGETSQGQYRPGELFDRFPFSGKKAGKVQSQRNQGKVRGALISRREGGHMQRLVGSLLVISGCIGFAGSLCRDLNLRLKLLKQIRGIYENMKYYIAYQKATIPETLRCLSEKEQEPFGEVFEEIYQGIYEGSENFTVLWKKKMDKVLLHTPLKQQEKNLLYDFPFCLGFMEEQAQAGALEELLRESALQIERLEQEKRNKNKMIMSLGVSVGILISILLI